MDQNDVEISAGSAEAGTAEGSNELTTALEFCLDFTYEKEKAPALTRVGGAVEKGKCVVLCGSSGCGKTTLLRCINQLIPQFYEGELKGFCRIRDRDLENLSIGETGQLAASVFQDPRSQFFTMNSSTEIAFGLENFGLSHREITDRVSQAFEKFGLQRLRNRNVFELSSGERQLIAILAAWAADTDLLLLDEPTANLDFGAVSGLQAVLRQLKSLGKTMVISEHRLCYLNDIADEYWLMDNGKIIRRLSPTQMSALSEAQRCELGLRCADLNKLTRCPVFRKPVDGHRFRAENLSFSYGKSGVRLLSRVCFQAETGEVIGIVGRNGCGKTTLGKLACGLLQAGTGSFYLDDTRLKEKQLREKSIFIMQEAEFQFFTNSVMNELCYGQPMTEQRREDIQNLLKSVNMWQCRHQHPFSLSGGQMQKLVLLLAYLSPKPVVVLDEPSAGLDYASLISCSDLIRRMSENKIVLIITHDPELIGRVCTRCIRLEEGNTGKEYDFASDGCFEVLKRNLMSLQDGPAAQAQASVPERWAFDPRACLPVVLSAMLAGIGTNLPAIGTGFFLVMLVYACQLEWKKLVSGSVLMGTMFLLYDLFPGVLTAFLISFFPRVVLIAYGAVLLAGKTKISRTLAGLRKLRVPEKLIMILSVAFRFFPVLRKDLSLMSESIQTRGFFPRLRDKLTAVPAYLEVMVVPMVFRVIRIAEALSASAETRGISLPGRRESYIGLKMKWADWCILSLTAAAYTAVILIQVII